MPRTQACLHRSLRIELLRTLINNPRIAPSEEVATGSRRGRTTGGPKLPLASTLAIHANPSKLFAHDTSHDLFCQENAKAHLAGEHTPGPPPSWHSRSQARRRSQGLHGPGLPESGNLFKDAGQCTACAQPVLGSAMRCKASASICEGVAECGRV